jgi:hypothetical protein
VQRHRNRLVVFRLDEDRKRLGEELASKSRLTDACVNGPDLKADFGSEVT